MSLMIKFQTDLWFENTEPHRFISSYDGEILGTADVIGEKDDADEPHVTLGKIHLYLIDVGRAIDEGQSLFEVMDSLSAETMECYEAIIDRDIDDWKEEVSELIGEDASFRHHILLINHLELNKKARGRSVGRQVVEEVISRFGSICAVITCKPFALQYRGYGNPEHSEERKTPGYEKKRVAAFDKVAKFWKGLGFRKLPSSDHYVWVAKSARNNRERCQSSLRRAD